MACVLSGSTASSSMSVSRLIDVNVKKIRDVKLLLQQNDDGETYPSEDDRTVGTAKTAEAFINWTETRKDIKCDLVKGKIVIRELPSTPHARCQGIFIIQISRQGELEPLGPVDVVSRVNPLDVREPDAVVMVPGMSVLNGANTPGSTSYVVAVLEVACKQQPRDLHDRATWFLGPNVPCVQYYIGIKKYDQRENTTMAMVAVLYSRANGGARPLEVISFGDVPLWHTSFFTQWIGSPTVAFRGLGFGDPPCMAAGMPSYTINLNTAYMYATHAAGIPAGAPPQYQLDLFDFRRSMLADRSTSV